MPFKVSATHTMTNQAKLNFNMPTTKRTTHSIGEIHKPNQKIVEEEFEQSDDVVSWEGGSTDFSFEDESPIKENINKTNIPESEEL